MTDLTELRATLDKANEALAELQSYIDNNSDLPGVREAIGNELSPALTAIGKREIRVELDLAKAYRQMEENPEILDSMARLVLETTYDDVAFEGWIARTRSRQLDVDKNPKGEWSEWYYQSAHRSNNPYVYQKGKCGKSEHRIDPIYGKPTIPFPNYYAPGYDRSNYQADLKASNDSRPILGYYERVREVRPAAIVVPK